MSETRSADNDAPRGGHFTPGHCEDMDGGTYHLPGQCPGAIVNCNGGCCSPASVAPPASDTTP